MQPIIDHDCWNLTPMIHSINPLMWVSQMGINLHQMERLAPYPGANRPIPHAAASLDIQPGMSFAFEPNVCRGNHRLNVGGAAIVTDGDPEILNNLTNRLNRVN
ncbi:MAG: hypothetical protein CMM10_00350 [Rhodospirillaceae bacterium]|nr:hypothetical protein [Rhodospirillaceae bacterium]